LKDEAHVVSRMGIGRGGRVNQRQRLCDRDAAIGFSNSAPDEFRVVTKAPLTIPPD
jgi:Protein of unknown function (DUF3035).